MNTIEAVNSLDWYHKIDLGNGVVTPGHNWELVWQPIEAAIRALDLRGKQVLDIGCWDGKFTFLAESLGATVTATDLQNDVRQKRDTFALAANVLKSRAEYMPNVDVCKLSEFFPPASFDVIIFAGVLYHLRYPMFALSQIRRTLKPGGVMICESHSIVDDRSFIVFNYKDNRDFSNWTFPTTAAIRKMVESSYFSVESVTVTPINPATPLKQFARRLLGRDSTVYARTTITAKAVERQDDAHLVPDSFLADCDLRWR